MTLQYPSRTFCIAADSAVRMIDSEIGDVLSTLLMPMSVTILDIGYSHKMGMLVNQMFPIIAW